MYPKPSMMNLNCNIYVRLPFDVAAITIVLQYVRHSAAFRLYVASTNSGDVAIAVDVAADCTQVNLATSLCFLCSWPIYLLCMTNINCIKTIIRSYTG